MDYIDCFVSGPLDGNRERSPYRLGRHPGIVGRQLVEAGLTMLGIYQHGGNHVSENTTERIYQYLRSLPVQEGHDFIMTNDRWKDDRTQVLQRMDKSDMQPREPERLSIACSPTPIRQHMALIVILLAVIALIAAAATGIGAVAVYHYHHDMSAKEQAETEIKREVADLQRKNAWKEQVLERVNKMYEEGKPETEIRAYQDANWDKPPAGFQLP